MTKRIFNKTKLSSQNERRKSIFSDVNRDEKNETNKDERKEKKKREEKGRERASEEKRIDDNSTRLVGGSHLVSVRQNKIFEATDRPPSPVVLFTFESTSNLFFHLLFLLLLKRKMNFIFSYIFEIQSIC